MDLFTQLTSELASLKDSRRNWENTWQEIGDLVSPNRSDFLTLRTA